MKSAKSSSMTFTNFFSSFLFACLLYFISVGMIALAIDYLSMQWQEWLYIVFFDYPLSTLCVYTVVTQIARAFMGW